MDSLATWLKENARQAVDFILPPTCGLCREVVAQPGALCPSCWRSVSFIAAPWCGCCGVPFGTAIEEGTLCAPCLSAPPPYGKARAAMAYDETSRKLVSRFKYSDQTNLLPTLVPWLVRAAQELLPVDVIVPVPLHRWRLLRRKYNQAALLALAVGDELGLPVDLFTLQRRRHTKPQVGMKREARLKNVRDAFVVTGNVTGKTVLLVDDVLTTGATLEACSEALLNAGAAEVRVLTLARVIRPEQVT